MLFFRRKTERLEQLEDARLAHRAVRGDRAAATELARRVGPVVRARVGRALRGRGLGHLDDEDVVQEVWRRLFERDGARLRGFDPEQASLGGYVNLIAGQTIAQLIAEQRAQKRRPAAGFAALHVVPEPSEGAPSAEARVVDRAEAEALWAHLRETLPSSGRLVMSALFVDHLSPQEAADRLGMKRATVDSWRYKAKEAARAWRAERAKEAR